jgi:hypothetical protein
MGICMKRKMLIALAFVAGVVVADQQVGSGYVYGGNDPGNMQNQEVRNVLNGFNPIGPGQYVVVSNPDTGAGSEYRYSTDNGSWYQGNGGGGSAACGGSMQRPCPRENGVGPISI